MLDKLNTIISSLRFVLIYLNTYKIVFYNNNRHYTYNLNISTIYF